ncbi:hypothetical protein KR222_005314, partial [Zaprionus bogoriensis]
SIVCRGCKLQRYCALQHLVEDRAHRDICRVLCDLQRSQNVEHPLLVNGVIHSQAQLQQTIGQLMLTVRVKLRRRLKRRERELIGYAAHCAVCYRLDALTPCQGCAAVAYCSPEHRRRDRTNHTPAVCQTLALYYSPYRWRDCQELAVKDLLQSVQLQHSHLVEAFHQATGIVVDSKPWRTWKDYQRFANCSSFSGIGSMCLALTRIHFVAAPHEILCVYVVGATEEQRSYFREIHLKFFFLQYQEVCQLDVYFIGHKLQSKPGEEVLTFELKVVSRTFAMTFQNFARMQKVDPVLIMIYNPDFASMDNLIEQLVQQQYPHSVQTMDKVYDWRPCLLETLYTYGVPICFTSPTRMQSRSDLAYVCALARELEITVKPMCNCRENPYREILPLHNPCPDDKETVIYANNYLEVIFTSIKS